MIPPEEGSTETKPEILVDRFNRDNMTTVRTVRGKLKTDFINQAERQIEHRKSRSVLSSLGQTLNHVKIREYQLYVF